MIACLRCAVAETVEDLEAEILVGAKRAEDTHLGRLCAHVAGCDREPALPDDGVAEREVVAEEPPAPRLLEARPSEEAHEVQVLRAEVAGRHAEPVDLELAQDVLHGDDLEGLGVSADAQPRAQQRLHQRPLMEVELRQGDAGAVRLRDEVPVEAPGMVHRILAGPPLLAGERVEEGLAQQEHAHDRLRRLVRRVHQTSPL